MFHALALVVLALAMDRWGGVTLQWAGGLWLAGILLFFRKSLCAEPHRSFEGLGAVHPSGGVLCFPAGLGIAGLGSLEEGGPDSAAGSGNTPFVPGRGIVDLKGCHHGKKQWPPRLKSTCRRLSEERAEALGAVRRVVLDHLPPGYVETMNWGMICYEVSPGALSPTPTTSSR